MLIFYCYNKSKSSRTKEKGGNVMLINKGKKDSKTEENVEKANKSKENPEQENKIVETRTIEQLLRDLRQEKNWSYWNVVDELTRKGIILNEKTIKKWEYGLEYPDLDIIYKLSEIYLVPSENFVIAKNNSFKEGYETIHMELIKRICYITGISIKVGYIAMYVFIGLALIWSLLFFIGKCNEYLLVRSIMN